MTLPILQQPQFTVTVPSTKKQIKLRPMCVREEKILLMAKESADVTAIMQAVKQVVQNCIGEKHDVNNFTLFDIDYLFIHIRANSIDPTIKITLNGPGGKPVEQLINLNDVTVKFAEDVNKVIKFGDKQAITLKYPEAKLYELPEVAEADSAEKLIEELLFHCFESYTEGEKIYKFAEASREECMTFIDSLPIDVYNKVAKFFEDMPHVFYEVKYKDTEDKDAVIALSRLSDFFHF